MHSLSVLTTSLPDITYVKKKYSKLCRGLICLTRSILLKFRVAQMLAAQEKYIVQKARFMFLLDAANGVEADIRIVRLHTYASSL